MLVFKTEDSVFSMYKLRTNHVIVFISVLCSFSLSLSLSLSLTSPTFPSSSSTPLLPAVQHIYFEIRPSHLLALLLLVSDCLIYCPLLYQQKHSLYCVEKKILYSVRC